MRIRVQTEPLDPGALLAAVCAGPAGAGAVVSFVGRARDATAGEPVERLELQAYGEFTRRGIEAIAREALARFAVYEVVVVHRWGEIAPGEAIVFVAAVAEHRRAAFTAADFLMDQLKTRAPFWKKEHGPGGGRWIEPRAEDCADAARWGADA